MKHFLIVVDMQKDFVNGALGTKEAVSIVPKAADKILGFDGAIIATFDTHTADYMNTNEGKHLPVVHCVKGTEGWQLDKSIERALTLKGYIAVEKPTFGSTNLPGIIRSAADGEEFDVELIGLCTDICVVSNALMIKASFPEINVYVDSACCAGVSVKTHEAALDVMRCCQIEIK